MLYTRTGDNGTSGLFGTKDRIPKDDSIYEALGTIDELNAVLGLCRARITSSKHSGDATHNGANILTVQEHLFVIQAELAGAECTLTQKEVRTLESAIEAIEGSMQSPRAFVIPGSNERSALYDQARTIARRGERRVIAILPIQEISSATLAYLNRLSSYLYALARFEATKESVREPQPSYIGSVKSKP